MKHWRSATMQCISIVMNPTLCQQTNTVTCTWAGIVIWRGTHYKWCSLRTASSSGFVLLFNHWISENIELINILVVKISISFKLQERAFLSVQSILRMHWSINAVPSNRSTARCSTSPNQALTRRSLMRTSNTTGAFDINVFAIHCLSWPLHSGVDGLLSSTRDEALVNKLGVDPESNNLATFKRAFDVIPREMPTR